MATYAWQHIFGDFGKLVKVWLELESDIEGLESRGVEVQDRFNDDVYDSDFQGGVITTIEGFRAALEGNRTSMVSAVSSYIINTFLLRLKIDSPYQTADDVILHMIERMNQDIGYESLGQTVRGNEVGIMLDWTEAGDAFAQLSAYQNILGLSSDHADAAGLTYFDIVAVGGGFYRVDIFNAAAKTPTDLVGHTAAYNADGYQNIIEDNGSGLSGRIRVNNVIAPANIIITWVWLGERTGDGVVSQWEATQMALDDDDFVLECINADTAGSEQWTIRTRLRGLIPRTSGLITTGVAFPAADVQDLAGFSITIGAGATGYAVGDTFELKTRSNDQGLFQSFFRDAYERFLPYVLDGTETIPDTLAQ
jgi:hypothetical protein